MIYRQLHNVARGRIKEVLTALLLFCFGHLYASGPFVIKPDTTVCTGDQVQFYVDQIDTISGTNVYSFNSIPFTPEPYTGTQVVMSDDDVDGPFPIGFTFCFFGNTYTQFYIGSNGWLGFSPGQPTSFTPQSIPNTATNVPKNCIMGPWQDWHPGIGGAIRYQTTGAAPNRKLVLSFDHVPMFGCTSTLGTFQIVLNEGSNLIKNYIEDKPFCSWVGNAATQGIHNPTGTAAYVVNGRNGNSWTAANEGWDFIPGGLPGYQVDWFVGGTQVGSGENVTLTANANMAVVARLTYTCSGTVFYDTVNVTVNDPPDYNITSLAPSCIGTLNGSITVNILSGSSPFQYSWNTSPPQNTATATGLGAGNYTVSITDSAGCTVQSTIDLSAPPALVIEDSLTSPSCWNSNDGQILLSSPNATPPLSFDWSNGGTSNPATSLSSGTYMVTVTDSNGCTAVDTFTLAAPPQLNFILNRTNISCNGANNGSISANFSGGTPPYQIQWSTGQSGISITGLPPGSYSATITDSKGCQRFAFANITQPPPINLSINKTNIGCNGGSNGSIAVFPVGGTGSFNYNWSTGATTSSIAGKPAGTYSVTVTDGNNCSRDSSITLTQPPALLDSLTIVQPACGGALGSITAYPYGGTGGFTYGWSNGQNTQTVGNLNGGTYILTITDGNNCTQLDTANLINPGNVSGTLTTSDVTCNGGSTGYAVANPTGGTTPYSYNWSSGQNVDSIGGLSAGSYIVTVSDSNGCTWTDTAIISEPTALLLTLSSTNVTCYGGSDGTASISASGGSPAYQFNWSNGQSGTGISGLASGTYVVTASDANSCVAIDSVTVTQPQALTSSLSITDAVCTGANGSVTASVSGGSPGYTFSWSNGGSAATNGGLVAGTYYLTGTDNQGCVLYDTATVASLPGNLSISLGASAEVCVGQNGKAWVTASGGNGPYAIAWSNSSSTDTISNLNSGIYTVTVTDANSCTAIDSVVVANDPGSLSVSLNATSTTCTTNNGTVTATPSGGTSPYTYGWIGGQNSASINGLSAGTYSVTVTDVNGCSVYDSSTVTQVNDPINISLSSSAEICTASDGSAQASVSGGTTPYTYVWSNGGGSNQIQNVTSGTYLITVTDVNGCSNVDSVIVANDPGNLSVSLSTTPEICGGSNGSATAAATGGTLPITYTWSNGGSTSSLSNLAAGMYAVTLTDANGCTVMDSMQVANNPGNLTVAVSGVDPTCNGSVDGLVQVTVNSGNAPYSFQWNTGSGNDTLFNQGAGVYTVTVTDATNCSAADTLTLTEPLALSNSFQATMTSCFNTMDGAITATVTGGTSPYQYAWSNGGTGANITGLAAGMYILTITDANNCQVIDSQQVQAPLAIVTQIAGLDPTCNSSSDGMAWVQTSGGTPGYSFQWSGGVTNDTIQNVSAGQYFVTVTDQGGCTQIDSLTLIDPTQLSVSLSVSDPSCNQTLDGSITANANGGTGALQYSWTGGYSGPILSGIGAGTYRVTVTDQNSCSLIDSATLIDPAPITLATGQEPDICNGGNGRAWVTPSGGAGAPYTYQWNTGFVQDTISGLSAGAYSVTVTDANGCTQTTSVTVVVGSGNLTATSTTTDVTCNGGMDGQVALQVGSGANPISYSWNTGASGNTLTGLPAGTYFYTVTDANNCQVIDSAMVTEPTPIGLNSQVSNVSCAGQADGSISLTAFGGTAPHSYAWSTGTNGPSISGLTSGTYRVTVTDQASCTKTDSFTITEPPAITVSVTGTDISCAGNNDGTLHAQASGGNPAYSYAWNNGMNGSSLQNLSPGFYNVTATDVSGCAATDTLTLAEPLAISITMSAGPANCTGSASGYALAPASGGQGALQYLWNSGAITDSIGGLIPGWYTVTVTDANGCSQVDSVEVTQPSSIQVSLTATPELCFGGATGSISASVSGGNPGYTYSWSTGGNGPVIASLSAGSYTVTVTDASGCTKTSTTQVTEPAQLQLSLTPANVSCAGGADGAITASANGGTTPYGYSWSTSSSNPVQSGLSAGKYYVTLTDGNGCGRVDSATVTEPNAINISISIQDVSCHGAADGRILVSASGGAGNFSYNWAGGIQGNVRNNLGPGSYQVTVVDANGCTQSANPAVSEPAPLTVQVSTTDAICTSNNGSAYAQAIGGTPVYSFDWDNGSQGDSITNLKTGTYFVTVTDNNGCTTTGNGTVGNSGSLNASISADDITCFGANDGQAAGIVLSGNPPYLFDWSNGRTDSVIMGLGKGGFSVTITDKYGCRDSSQVTINEPTQLMLSLTGNNPECNGEATGMVKATAMGGVSPYNFNWQGGPTTASWSGVPAGTYQMILFDANGCQTVDSITLTEPAAITLDAGPTQVIQEGTHANLQAIVAPTGSYSYQWSPAVSVTDPIVKATTATPDQTTIYTVVVTNGKGCTAEDTVRVVVKPPVKLFIPTAFSPNGDGRNDVFKIVGGPFDYFHLSIYDRWGSLIFETSDEAQGWDGHYNGALQGIDTYIYVVRATDEFGVPFIHQGNVILLR